MRIFLTGGTGYIGSSVLDALVRAGHDVTALVRTAERAAQVEGRSARSVIGNLADPDTYRRAASGHDGYVHTAFESSARGVEVDRQAIETLLEVAADSGRGFFIYTSSTWVLGQTRDPLAEEAPVNPIPLVAWRPAHEQRVLGAATGALRTMVVRPAVVYGGARGILGDMFRDASNGLMRVIGPGDNHWPLVYDRDLGDLYARLAARPDTAGIYHANDEADERVIDFIEAIAQHMPTKPELRHVPLAEARTKMGRYAEALALDQRVRSPRARALGWAPSLGSFTRSVPRLLDEWRSGREAAQRVD